MPYKVSEEDGYNGSITFLVSENGVTIEICDEASNTRFVEVTLDVQQLAEMLSRRENTPCNVAVRNLDRVGKKMLMGQLEFEMPPHDYGNRKDIASAEAMKRCPDGWIPDKYYGSKDSFYTKGGKQYARTTIRKYEAS